MQNTIDLLLEEVNSNLKELKSLKKGSDEYGNVVSDVTKLLDKATPMIKIQKDAEERAKNRQEDLKVQANIRKEDAAERAKIRQEDRNERAKNREEDKQERADIRKEEADERAKNREEDKQERIKNREEDKQERADIRKEEKQERIKNREEDKADKKGESMKNLLLEGCKIAVPLLMFGITLLDDHKMSDKILTFEETGTLTSTVGRNFFGHVGRSKKNSK